jgi:hypothetical protein
MISTANRRNEAALFDEIYVRLAQRGEQGLDVFQLNLAGRGQVIQLIERDGAGWFRNLNRPSD